MNKKQVDVVVCTKDRPENLISCVEMIAKLIPYDTLYVLEGSLKPNYIVLDYLVSNFGVKMVYVPYLKFGAVRNLVMRICKTDYVAMIDDDITLAFDWYDKLMEEFKDDSVMAAGSRLILDHPLISKLSLANTRVSGGSGGASIYDVKKVLSVGNFDKNIHRGEDMELELRIVASGQKWVKSNKTFALHPITVREFLSRAKANVVGWDFIMRESRHKTVFMIKRFGSTLVMPTYYFWKTFDLRCAGLWAIYKWQSLLYWLSGRYVR